MTQAWSTRANNLPGISAFSRLLVVGVALTMLCALAPAAADAGLRRAGKATKSGKAANAANAANAAKPERKAYRHSVFAAITAIDGERVEIARGSRHGLEVGRADLIVHPLRAREREKSRSFDGLVVLAAARVEKVEPGRAVLRLQQISEPVEVGDVVTWRIEPPPQLADDPLFRVAALDVSLKTLADKRPLYDLADRVADPSKAAADAILAAMVKEIASHEAMADKVYARVEIPGGRFHGLRLSQALAKTTTKDVEDFLVFVDAYPGKYIGGDWVLINVYATWIINRTPSGESERLERRARPVLERAEEACERGDLDAGEKAYREALTIAPGLEAATKKLDQLEKVERLRRDLKRTPDDHAKRYDLMVALGTLQAWPLVGGEAERLEKAGFRVHRCRFWRAVAAENSDKIDEAIATLEATEVPASDTYWRQQIDRRLAALRARKAVGPVSGGEFAQRMADAEAAEKAGHYEDAQRKLARARSAAETPQQFAQVGAASARIGALRAIESSCTKVAENLRDHEHSYAQKRIAALPKLARRHHVEAMVAKCLADAADAGRAADEHELALEAAQAAVALTPDNATIVRTLAWTAWIKMDLDVAETAIARAIELDESSNYAWHMRGLVRLARHDYDGAERYATRATTSKSYAWPRQTLSRVAAARGRWSEAIAHAREALALAPTESMLQYGMHEALSGAEAATQVAKTSGPAQARARLRLLRILTAMGLFKRVAEELDALRGTAHFDAACWTVAESTDRTAPLALRAAAAAAGKPDTPRRFALRDRLAAEATVVRLHAALKAAKGPARANAKAGLHEARVRFAALLVREGAFDRALADVGQLATRAADKGLQRLAADVETAARRGLDAEAKLKLADAARARGGQTAVAERLYGEAQESFEAISALSRAVSAAFSRAATMASHGEIDAALALIKRLEPVIEGHVAPLARLDMASITAGLLSWRGKLDAVSRAIAEAMTTCEALDEDLCVEFNRIRRAGVSISEGRLADATRDATAALAFAKERGFGNLHRQALFQLGDARLVEGDLPAVVKIATELRARSIEGKDDNNERLALMLQGAVAMRRGDGPAALGYFGDVLRVGERMGDAGVQAIARLFEGFTQLDTRHDAKAALPAFEAASTLFASVGDDYSAARAKHGVGRSQAELGALDAARAVFGAVLAFAEGVGRRTMVAGVHVELCHVELKAKAPARALQHATAAMAIIDKVDIPSQQAAGLHALGLAMMQSGDDKGVEKLREAARIVAREIARSGGDSEQQGALGVGRARRVFQDAIDALIKLGRTNEALEILELSRDAALKRTFRNVRPEVSDKAAGAAIDGVADQRARAEADRRALEAEKSKPDAERSEARIRALGERIADSEAKVRQLLFRLKAHNPRLYTLAANVADPQILLQSRGSLPDDALVVAYFVASDALYIFTIRKDRRDTKAYKVAVGEGELRRTIASWRNAVTKKTPKVGVLGRKLYDKLLGPIEAETAAVKTLLVVPSGPIFNLPLGALEHKVGGKSQFAIERWQIVTMMRTTMTALMNAPRQGRWASFAAFANPDGTLPGAQTEVERVVGEVFKGASACYGTKAAAEAVRAVVGKAHILHFATHGVLAGEAADSYLTMANGPMTLDLISGLDFGVTTDLVVLSACQTAVSVGETAEEGISIAEAFAIGGVPTLIASLWSVPDDATSVLMVHLYRALQGGNAGAGAALRQAQLALIAGEGPAGASFRHPLYWAAFGLIGDPR